MRIDWFKPLFYLVLCFALAGCSAPYAEEDLEGQWKGVSITEDGYALPNVSPEELRFRFSDTGYTYQGNLNYQEAGAYTLSPPYLYTTDTFNQATTEKTVEIIMLTTDSLHLRMMENGKERLLKLIKEI